MTFNILYNHIHDAVIDWEDNPFKEKSGLEQLMELGEWFHKYIIVRPMPLCLEYEYGIPC